MHACPAQVQLLDAKGLKRLILSFERKVRGRCTGCHSEAVSIACMQEAPRCSQRHACARQQDRRAAMPACHQMRHKLYRLHLNLSMQMCCMFRLCYPLSQQCF